MAFDLTRAPERRSIAAMLGFDGACPVAQLYGVKPREAEPFTRPGGFESEGKALVADFRAMPVAVF